jgi:hypothetical protein
VQATVNPNLISTFAISEVGVDQSLTASRHFFSLTDWVIFSYFLCVELSSFRECMFRKGVG